MKKCSSCGNRISRWYIIKETLGKKQYPLVCDQCGQKLYFTARSLKISYSLVPVLPIVLLLLLLFHIPDWIAGVVILILLTSLFVIYPSIVQLTNDEERWF
ncbi:TIGR04104 family putative zinc finger protein [Halobacillus rhizosphaerae]|uniref:TIGR04104 family putative zinc finger protein n=1 Tax=Halobacillus rhizosphaerae TaxID=3064889 RepID=UPI00398AA5D2